MCPGASKGGTERGALFFLRKNIQYVSSLEAEIDMKRQIISIIMLILNVIRSVSDFEFSKFTKIVGTWRLT